MDARELKALIERCHAVGKPVAISFCSQVPLEILEAAGVCAFRIPYVKDVPRVEEQALPSNICPLVKTCCALCEGDALEDADLILAETSCDGKKKMYELLSSQDRVYYYQIPQGVDRGYAGALIRSECSWLVRMLQTRFGVEITEEKLRGASRLLNMERESVTALMAVQLTEPPKAWGCDILEELEKNRVYPSPTERAAANLRSRDMFLTRSSPVPESARRILLTGCPSGGIYHKIVGALEQNGGVAVCFENCETAKSSCRHVNAEARDILSAIADCYLETACAIMSPNTMRFSLIEEMAERYRVDGVFDLGLQACHSYTVERDKMRRFCAKKGLPYLFLETGFKDSDLGQLTTRISAFLEMI